MHQVSVEEAKKQFADLVAAASAGNEIIITEDGKPLARLVPIASQKKSRVAGLNRGSIWTSEDFDEPLGEEFWMRHC